MERFLPEFVNWSIYSDIVNRGGQKLGGGGDYEIVEIVIGGVGSITSER